MRPKDLNTGLRGGVFDGKHCRRMGQAIWLYGWLVLRQTTEQGATGLVLSGRPITYRQIEEETGFNRRTLERWMGRLRRQGYIQTSAAVMERAAGGLVVRILKAKKFGARQRQLEFAGPTLQTLGRPDVERGNSMMRAPGRRVAEGCTQICGAGGEQATRKAGFAGRIESGKTEKQREESPAQNTGYGKALEPTRIPGRPAFRTAREEQAQRELRVGAAPELTTGSVKAETLERLRQRRFRRTASAGE